MDLSIIISDIKSMVFSMAFSVENFPEIHPLIDPRIFPLLVQKWPGHLRGRRPGACGGRSATGNDGMLELSGAVRFT